LDLDFSLHLKKFWTVVGLALSFKKSGLDLEWIAKYDSPLIRDEHWTGLGSDWIRSVANFVEF